MFTSVYYFVAALFVLLAPSVALAQESTLAPTPEPPTIDAGAGRDVLVNTSVKFDVGMIENLPPDTTPEILWNFGDGVRTTGESVSHTYTRPGSQ
jgi:hypothetical protein